MVCVLPTLFGGSSSTLSYGNTSGTSLESGDTIGRTELATERYEYASKSLECVNNVRAAFHNDLFLSNFDQQIKNPMSQTPPVPFGSGVSLSVNALPLSSAPASGASTNKRFRNTSRSTSVSYNGLVVMLGDDGYDWHMNGRNISPDQQHATHYFRCKHPECRARRRFKHNMTHPIQTVDTLIQDHCHLPHEAPASVAGDQNTTAASKDTNTSSRANNKKRRHQETVGQENCRSDDETDKKRNVAKPERVKMVEIAEDMRPIDMVNRERRSLPVFETSEAKVVEAHFCRAETYSSSV